MGYLDLRDGATREEEEEEANAENSGPHGWSLDLRRPVDFLGGLDP